MDFKKEKKSSFNDIRTCKEEIAGCLYFLYIRLTSRKASRVCVSFFLF